MDTHKGMTVKVLLDSRATGLFVDKSFVENHGFKRKKLVKPIEVRNVDRTNCCKNGGWFALE